MYNKALLKIVKVYAPTTSHTEEDVNSFYNDVYGNLGKSNHYTLVMGDFSAQIGKLINLMETGTCNFGLELRKDRGDTLVEWATPRKYKKYDVKKKAWRR